jgi:hypothetical protein
VDREEGNQSKKTSSEDLITQQEMASQLIFQKVEYPSRTSLLERFKNGAQIEPGPLTIVQPYFDLGPFIIPSSEATRRAEQVRQCIREANLALEEIDQQGSAAEFCRVTQQMRARVWEAVLERRNASLQARNWDGFRARVRDHLYACEVSWMLWAATKCAALGLRRLGKEAFGIASAQATALASI